MVFQLTSNPDLRQATLNNSQLIYHQGGKKVYFLSLTSIYLLIYIFMAILYFYIKNVPPLYSSDTVKTDERISSSPFYRLKFILMPQNAISPNNLDKLWVKRKQVSLTEALLFSDMGPCQLSEVSLFSGMMI